MVGETPLIRGCRSLILNELAIKITGKNSYEIEYHQNVGQAVKRQVQNQSCLPKCKYLI